MFEPLLIFFLVISVPDSREYKVLQRRWSCWTIRLCPSPWKRSTCTHTVWGGGMMLPSWSFTTSLVSDISHRSGDSSYFMATVIMTGPERSGLVSCEHWMMPMLWSGGRADKTSNKLAGDIACLGGSMVEHQPHLLGSRRFPAGVFAIFSVSAKASLPIPFPFLPFPFSFPSSSFPFPSPSDLSFALKKRILRIYPIWWFLFQERIGNLACHIILKWHMSSILNNAWSRFAHQFPVKK